MAGISSGRILSVKEVIELGPSLQGNSVRTWGRVISHDLSTSHVQIKDGTQELTINTALVEPLAFVRGSLYHFIGEANRAGNTTIIKARIAGCIDGMDMELFQQALKMRRQYLGKQMAS
ncbi:CST complex subunit TEN1 [Nematostella vectensis]|uniref:CST complex subunit TEN1 n=1 Tax=Nematostella vectensis TaxID=45351 RepID=UPI00207796E6|nr:CST complex subunit TEN1 [Nematostella vectensis]